MGVCRVGITVSKKIGNAVERNRARRIIRAAFRNVLAEHETKGNFDLVFVARTKTKYLKSTQLEKSMTEILKEVGVI